MTAWSDQRPARDWSKELWIKQHIREPLNELLSPLMQRALRDYLRKRAEADGTLIVDRDHPVDALVRALGAHESEFELARQAVADLLDRGVLETNGRSIWMPERPDSQMRAPAATAEEAPSHLAPLKSKQTSTQRVRDYRERRRNELIAQGGVSPSVSPVPEGVSSGVSRVPQGVSLGVSSSVSPSRGDRSQDPSLSAKDQKDQRNHLHHPERAHAPVSVSLPVSSSVSSRETMEDEEDDETLDRVENGNAEKRCGTENDPTARPPKALPEALEIEIGKRAALVVDKPELAESLRPDQWPEVRALPIAFAAARGCPTQPLGRYAQDSVVKFSVALYAAGYSQTDLVHVVSVIAKQEWTKGKGLGSLLTFKVVDANRFRPPVKAERPLSPRAAQALARARAGERVREAG